MLSLNRRGLFSYKLENQKGAVQLIVILILLAGITVGVYLVNREEPLKFLSGAQVSEPIPPSPSPTPPSPPADHRRVFITSTTYNGNLGGLQGADQKCQERANTANLGGKWKAWLSDASTSASLRLEHSNVPYKLLNGTTIANNWADLTDGNIQNPINVNEFNSFGSGTSWTNTNEYGDITSPGPCNNWTSDNEFGRWENIMGNYLKTDFEWTMWRSATQCSTPQTLYCFEQTSVTPTPTPDTTPPTVSITNPLNGSTVRKNNTVNITANASDSNGIAKVDFDVGGTITCTDTSSPYGCAWEVPKRPRVTYSITAKAYDTASNSAQATITVTSK